MTVQIEIVVKADHEHRFEEILSEGNKRIGLVCSECFHVVGLSLCEQCAWTFEAKTPKQKYCCTKCRLEAYKEREQDGRKGKRGDGTGRKSRPVGATLFDREAGAGAGEAGTSTQDGAGPMETPVPHRQARPATPRKRGKAKKGEKSRSARETARSRPQASG